MYMLLNKFSKADRSEAARQEETPKQRQARLNDKVSSSISILYNLSLLIITSFLPSGRSCNFSQTGRNS